MFYCEPPIIYNSSCGWKLYWFYLLLSHSHSSCCCFGAGHIISFDGVHCPCRIVQILYMIFCFLGLKNSKTLLLKIHDCEISDIVFSIRYSPTQGVSFYCFGVWVINTRQLVGIDQTVKQKPTLTISLVHISPSPHL